MLLRPAKIFSPLHQLRHYLESKVAELVQQQPTVSSALHNAKSRFYTASQQQALTKVQFNPKAPTLYHVAEQQQQRLLKALQQQFPIVKVFSAPTIVKPYQLSFARPQQFRTIVSSSSSSSTSMLSGHADGFYAAANGFYNSGGFFPRTVVGYARTPFAARQFSTVKSPCVTLFQQTTSTTTTNTGFSHISSRFFSPAGSKMSSPFNNGNESHAKPSPVPSTASNDTTAESSTAKAQHNKPLFSRQETKGMSELIQEEHAYANNKRHGLVRRGSVDRRVSRHKFKLNPMRFDYIQHDDLSCKYTPHRKGATVRHHWHSSRVKAPPDKKCIYLSFQLDGSALWNELPSKSQLLDKSLISTLTSVADIYQMYLAEVVVLLTELQRHGKKFRAMLNGNELCVLFPSSEHWPEQERQTLARKWLMQIGINPDSPYVVLKEMVLPDEPLRHLESVDDEAVGPDYFKGIQAFLDHVDDLIETGPDFNRH